MGIGTLDSRTPAELLHEFVETGRQAPFEEIVRRYAGMVFHTCVQVTKNAHDAEDVTQAVFLTLAIQAKQTQIKAIGPWLQQVAYRLSLDVRKSHKRREIRENKHHEISRGNGTADGHAPAADHAADADEIKGLLAEELNKLPTKYRLPLILHYYGGMSREEMARELNCKPSTLGVRLFRGREMLGNRLAERGIVMAGGTLAVALTMVVREAVSETMISQTCVMASHVGMGHSVSAYLIPTHIMGLAKTAAKALIVARAKATAAAIVIAGASLAAGAQVVQQVVPNLVPDQLKNWNLRDWFRFDFKVPTWDLQAHDTRPTMPPAAANEAVVLSSRTTTSIDAGMFATDTSAAAPTIVSPGPARGQTTVIGAPLPLQLSTPPQTAPVTSVPTHAWTPGALTFQPPENRTPAMVIASGGSSYSGSARWRYSDVAATPMSEDSFDPTPDPGPTGFPSTPGRHGGGWGGAPSVASISIGPRPADGRSPVGSDSKSFEPPPKDEPVVAAITKTFRGHAAVDNFQLDPSANDMPLALVERKLAAQQKQVAAMDTAQATPDLNDNFAAQSGQALPEAVALHAVVTARTWERDGTTLWGHGTVTFAGPFEHSGVIVADGRGKNRTLDFSNVGEIEYPTDNAPGASNGGYAKDHGKLTLPAKTLPARAMTLTWLEAEADPTLDMVNSVRLSFAPLAAEGQVMLSLYATDRGDVPGLSEVGGILGVWGIDKGSSLLSDVEVSIRYDDVLMAEWGIDESTLELWKSDGLSAWAPVLGGLSIDTENNIIRGDAGAMRFFGIVGHEAQMQFASFGPPSASAGGPAGALPEPGVFGMLAVGALGLMGRRRRRW